MKAVTIGGAMVDSIAIIADDRIERMSMRNAQSSFLLLEEGRKIEADEISQHCGGGAVNSAVALARLDVDVSTILKVGKDQRAEMILRRLSDEGISTRWIMRDARLATGASVIVSSHERDAAVFTFRGANTLLSPGDLKADMFAGDLVYVTSLSNEAADCFPDIVELARRSNAMVAANPGIRQLTSRSAAFRQTLPMIDVLVLNRVEAEALVPQLAATARPSTVRLDLEIAPHCELLRMGLASGGYELPLESVFDSLLDCGVKYALITNGGDGAYLRTKDAVYHCPVVPVAVAGTAGAGDAFASTFVGWLVSSGDVVEALAAAALNASSVISYADTQTGLLSRTALKERLTALQEPYGVTHWQV